MVSFPRVLKKVRFPVPGFLSLAHSAGYMREHFIYRHFFSQKVVAQEGRETLPRCDLCDMQMPAGKLIMNQRTQQCGRNKQIRWQRRDIAIASRCMEASFSLTGEDNAECIETLETSKYLGRILNRSDEN